MENGAPRETPGAIAMLARRIDAALDDDERRLLVWVTEDVPRRQIAEWTGGRYEATRKRVQRLVARLRALVVTEADALPAAERRDVLRFLRRVGACPERTITEGDR